MAGISELVDEIFAEHVGDIRGVVLHLLGYVNCVEDQLRRIQGAMNIQQTETLIERLTARINARNQKEAPCQTEKEE